MTHGKVAPRAVSPSQPRDYGSWLLSLSVSRCQTEAEIGNGISRLSLGSRPRQARGGMSRSLEAETEKRLP